MTTEKEIFEQYFNTSKKEPFTQTVSLEKKATQKLFSELPQQYAQGNIGIYQFIEKLYTLINDAWGDEWGTLTVNGYKEDTLDSLNLPCIVFDTVERTPSKHKAGIKQRPSETYLDPSNPDYTIVVYRKWFDAIIEFLILDTTNQEAIQLAERFELFIDTFTGFFKEAGLSELVFYKEVDSRNSKNYIDHIPSRALHYRVVLESIRTERIRTTKTIHSSIQEHS